MKKILALMLVICMLVMAVACQKPTEPSTPADPAAPADPATPSDPAEPAEPEMVVPESLVICSSNVGNSWYTQAIKISEILMSEFPGLSVTVVEGAGDGNLNAVNAGTDAQLGIAASTSVVPALLGENEAVPDASNVVALCTLGMSVCQTAVPVDSEIQSFQDLVGKKVAAGATTSVTLYVFKAILEAYGIKPEDMTLDYAASSEYPDMFADNLIDACHINGAMPIATLVQVDSNEKIRLLPPSAEALAAVLEKYPSLYTTKVPVGTYSGVTEELELLAYDGMLFANKNIDGKFLAKVVELITECDTLDPKYFDRVGWTNYPTFINENNTCPEVWETISAHQG